MDLRSIVKRALPTPVLNETLLAFPTLYRTRLVNYETNLDYPDGVLSLLENLDATRHVDGDVVECGTSRGGSACLMALALLNHSSVKLLHAVDTFAGFDANELQRERKAGLTSAPNRAFTSTSARYVKRKLAVLRLDDVILLHEGLFTERLPEIAGPISFVFIDCDLSDSVAYCMTTLWPLMAPGARMVIDDYSSGEFRGARQAVDRVIETLEPRPTASIPAGRFYVAVKGWASR